MNQAIPARLDRVYAKFHCDDPTLAARLVFKIRAMGLDHNGLWLFREI